MSSPLEGTRVVEVATFVAAPACGALLADLGAAVVKIEVPWGEVYRHAAPRYAGIDSDFPGAPNFQFDNRGKRSLTLDLALPQALDALAKVVDRADVVLTNLLPARQTKYGLDPETLLGRRPELIIARVSGYGPDGPEANAPAFDYTAYWARTGLMDQLHHPDSPPPFQRPGIGDHAASLALTVGILSALRTRDQNGAGQVIDVALQHIGFYIGANDAVTALATGKAPPRHDRLNPPNPLWNNYRCRDDRWISLVMIESDRYWPMFTEVIGEPDLAKEDRFKDAKGRFRNSRKLVARLDKTFAGKDREEWAILLGAHRLIWAPVRTVVEAVSDPANDPFGSFPTVDHPELGRFRTVAPPFRMSANQMSGTAPAPALGADTADVLAEAGVDDKTIASLVAAFT